MTLAVENFALGNTEGEGDMLPRPEALVRLYELLERYSGVIIDVGIATAAARHRRAHGHELTYGCCRGRDSSEVVV